MATRPPLPPFTRETAIQKVRLAEDGWNSRAPEKVALAYALDSRCRNRSEFVNGRQEIVAFLMRKWTKELDYRLVKELWAFDGNRIAVSFACEWHDDSGNWLLCAIQDAQGRPGLSFVHPSERITVSTKCFFLISPISIERHDPVGGQVNTLAPRGGSLGGFSKSSIPTRGMEAFLKSICYHDLGFIVVESAQTLEFRNGLRIHALAPIRESQAFVGFGKSGVVLNQ